MTVAYADFVTAFPEFSNTTTYPQAQFDFWLNQSTIQLDAGIFGPSYDLATMLYVAHNIVLAAQSARSAAAGGAAVGAPTGLQTSKSVGPASVGYDVTATTLPGAGMWNATSYGQRLYALIRAFSAGPRYSVPIQTTLYSGRSPIYR